MARTAQVRIEKTRRSRPSTALSSSAAVISTPGSPSEPLACGLPAREFLRWVVIYGLTLDKKTVSRCTRAQGCCLPRGYTRSSMRRTLHAERTGSKM